MTSNNTVSESIPVGAAPPSPAKKVSKSVLNPNKKPINQIIINTIQQQENLVDEEAIGRRREFLG